MKNTDLAFEAEYIAKHLKTSYMLGTFGHFANVTNISSEVARTDVNNKAYEKAALEIKDKGWMFDCCGLIKGILWGFNQEFKGYGGAFYQSNGVPDLGADTIINKCTDISTDFTKIEIGEAVWVKGHIGIYIGDMKVVEATPRWTNPPGVKITMLGNLTNQGTMNRKWTKHGKLPWVDYTKSVKEGKEMRYNKLEEIPQFAKEAITYYVEKGFLNGGDKGNLDLSLDMIRVLTVLYRGREQ